MGRAISGRRLVKELAYGGLPAGAVMVVLFASVGSPPFRMAVSGVALALAAWTAAIACFLRARHCPVSVQRAWYLIAAAAGAWASSQCLAAYYQAVLGRQAPFPSLLDLGYGLFAPLFVAGLLTAPGAAHGLATRVRSLLDGLIIATSLVVVSWVLVLGLNVHHNVHPLADQICALSSPVADIVVATLILHVAARARAAGRPAPLPAGWLGLALLALLSANSGFYYLATVASYRAGGPVDAGALCAFLLLAVAARSPRLVEAEVPEVSRRSMAEMLPYVMVVAAILLGAADHDAVLIVVRTVLILGVVAKQLLAVAENRGLTARLEQRVQERTAELLAGEQRFAALVRHSSEAVSVVDLEGRISYQSESALAVLGQAAAGLVGRRFADLLDEESGRVMAAGLARVLDRPFESAVVDLAVCLDDGRRRRVETTITNLADEPSVRGLVLNTRDISEQCQLEQQLTHQAFTDSLTGLANRALFTNRLDQALLVGADVAVLFLDLDGFKEINDGLGHAAGDDLLCQIADRVSQCIRPGDTLARFGGDEFAVLLEREGDVEAASAMADRIVTVLRTEFVLAHRETAVRASVGIATADDCLSDAGQLLRNADLAMYRAKSAGGGTFVVYDPGMHSSLMQRLELERDLRQAVASGQIEVHYQPAMAIRSDLVVGFEALARWVHPERGFVSPEVFIPMAEQTHLIDDIGRIVLDAACAQLATWQRLAGMPRDLSMSVNISGHQLQRLGFVDVVATALSRAGVKPGSLILEITESVLFDDTEAALDVLWQLKALGVRLAIDDFGTGYSSLSYLHRLPIDILKIDKSFVDRLGHSADQEEVVGTIVQLGNNLHLTTWAEGIEDRRQTVALRRLGCHLAQGYYYARPACAAEIERLLIDRALMASVV